MNQQFITTIDFLFQKRLKFYPVQLGIFVFQGTAGPRSTWNVIDYAFQGTAGVRLYFGQQRRAKQNAIPISR